MRATVPRIPDGVIYRMLDKLLMLEGERLSYRALDVEQIGSVYEAIMGYEVEVAEGLSIAVKPKDVVINVEALLAEKPGNRAKVLQDWAECKLTGKGATALKDATTPADLVAALGSRVSSRTPNLLPLGGLYLQPGEERRRTGSHYTPRKLTQPIVETTLRPIFEQLGDHPTPEQILNLKVCDLAMGSAAFLVEACRQLAEKLVEAWDTHGTSPPSPLSAHGEGEPKNSSSPFSTSGEGGRGDEVQPVPGYIYALCRDLRKEQTNAEGLLWGVLRNRQFEGLKFRRQHPLGRYIADFYCAEHCLVIELDGAIHDLPEQQEYDRIREEAIRAQNLTVLRFSNEEVETNLENVLEGIYQTVLGRDLTSPPSPLSTSGEGGQEKEAPQGAESPSPAGRGVGVRASGDCGYKIPDDIEPILYARRLVAQRCLYGVDKNPFAVNLAKLSLWLVTLAKDQPFTFVDHALKCGDSLVGLTRAEIGSFGKDTTEDLPLFKYLKEKVDRAKAYRTQIQTLDTRTDADAEEKLAQWQRAERELEEAKLIGDVKIAAFFAGKSKKDREAKLAEYAELVREWRTSPTSPPSPLSTRGEGGQEWGQERGQEWEEPHGSESPSPRGRGVGVRAISDSIRNAEKPITPFNWEIEFPEVFDRENPGFDAIVGNPPFLGGRHITNGYGKDYLSWLAEVHPESSGNADLVSHFFRRAYTITRKYGTFGLIATNTIYQGDTRNSGLRFICKHGGTIYDAQKRVKWPGLAAVVISIVSIFKGEFHRSKNLNGREVNSITAYLFHAGGHDDPAKLLANKDKSYQGSITYGMGFNFDDSDDEATPIAKMKELVAKNPKNTERIFPYIGGSEVNTQPDHSYHRYVINFGEMNEEEAWEYPDLMEILRQKVKSYRQEKAKEVAEWPWWKFWRTRQELYDVISKLDRVLVTNAQASSYLSLIFHKPNVVFANSLNIFPLENDADFAVLQSRVHEVFAKFFSSSVKDDLRYNPSDCFETFPFPENWETDPTLETIGKAYYDYRADLMVRNNQGLTDTYNRFHDPTETHPDILHLRHLHNQMDRAVLAAYGWPDLCSGTADANDTTCGFALDYLDTDPDDLPPEAGERVASGDLFFLTPNEAAAFGALISTGKRKLPWRYKWPEATHDEVLARLLDLNQQRHLEEVRGHKAAKPDSKGKNQKAKGKGAKQAKLESETPTIPGMEV